MKKSRLNPNPASRPVLKELTDKKILWRKKVGLRYILRTNGMCEFSRFSVGSHASNRDISHFRRYPYSSTYAVQHDGQRARLTAAVEREDWMYFQAADGELPVNPVATDLLTQSEGHWGTASTGAKVVFGDAVLVKDFRMHWLFASANLTPNQVINFNSQLSSPREICRCNWGRCILFHEEPTSDDLFLIKMFWG